MLEKAAKSSRLLGRWTSSLHRARRMCQMQSGHTHREMDKFSVKQRSLLHTARRHLTSASKYHLLWSEQQSEAKEA
eukprot:scaffold1829_cov15-Tisochrysis_lutea.AAC.1